MSRRSLPEMPCGPLLELNGQRKRLFVPFGLKPLIERMAREVIKEQPDNIYSFLASYMETHVRKKTEENVENSRRKSWQIHRWSWEASSLLSEGDLTEMLANLKFRKSIAEANHYAVIIQKAYRGHHARVIVKAIRKSRQLDPSTMAQVKKEIDDHFEAQMGKQEDGMKSGEAPDAEAENNEGSEAYTSANENSEEEMQGESDYDTTTYEQDNDMKVYEETDEEEEVSLVDTNPPPDQEYQEEHEQELPSAVSSVPQIDSKVDSERSSVFNPADGEHHEPGPTEETHEE